MGMGFCIHECEKNIYFLELGSFNFLKSNITIFYFLRRFSGSNIHT